MPYCLNPLCQKPNNPASNLGISRFCANCGSRLQLKGLYEPIALLGQGGMGRTFKAENLGRLGQPCAIKQFLPQFPQAQAQNPQLMQKAIALFEREAAQLKDLGSHPQIPELIAYFEEEGYLYLVQELIEGENLSQELQLNGIFSEAQIEQLLENLLPVLQFIHDRQVIHRDIKPENIIRRSDASSNLVLVDFGAAKVFTNKTNRTGTLIGSAEYIAPEQARGKAVPQSDLYSLGITCIHLLTGLSPFDLYDDSGDRWIWQEKLATPISEHLAIVLNRLLERAIANRYRSANEVLEVLHSPKPEKSDHEPANLIAQLKSALSLGQWREGDQLTNQIILELAHKQKISELSVKDIQQISGEIWLAIDQVWMQSSNSRFGLRTQKRIWQSLGGKLIYEANNYWEFAATYEKFADRVGWRKSRWVNLAVAPKVWRKYENLIFAIAAPYGHLPSLLFWEGCNLVDAVFFRLEIGKTNSNN